MKHILIELRGCLQSELLNDRDFHRKLLRELIEKLNFTLIDEIVVKETSAGYNDWGLSGYALISTSHISFHSFLPQNWVFFDVFSCKEFSTEDVIDFLEKKYRPQKIDYKVLERGQGFDLYANYKKC